MHSGPGRCHDEGIAEKTPSACNASAARTPPVCLTHLCISRSAIRSERRCPDKSESTGRQAQRGEERRQQTKADAKTAQLRLSGNHSRSPESEDTHRCSSPANHAHRTLSGTAHYLPSCCTLNTDTPRNDRAIYTPPRRVLMRRNRTACALNASARTRRPVLSLFSASHAPCT